MHTMYVVNGIVTHTYTCNTKEKTENIVITHTTMSASQSKHHNQMSSWYQPTNSKYTDIHTSTNTSTQILLPVFTDIYVCLCMYDYNHNMYACKYEWTLCISCIKYGFGAPVSRSSNHLCMYKYTDGVCWMLLYWYFFPFHKIEPYPQYVTGHHLQSWSSSDAYGALLQSCCFKNTLDSLMLNN